MKKISKIFLLASFTILFLTICRIIPSYGYDGKTLSSKDTLLLTDRIEWSSHTEAEQFTYALMYMPRINMIMNLPPDTFKASQVHMMSKKDPNYGLACAYTNYGTGQIYICMEQVNKERLPGWGLVYTLAHETRHLYQNKYNTIAYNPDSVINNQAVYATDAREQDANIFATCFINYLLGRTDWK